MSNFNKGLEESTFIYGSFDFLRSGLGFALIGANISAEEKNEIARVIEKIGNYTTNNPNQVQWLSVKTNNNKHLILAFSFGGKDEHGRKTFISKGFSLSEKEFSAFHFDPFFILPYIKVDYSSLKDEISTKNIKNNFVSPNYDLLNASKMIENNLNDLKIIALSIWTNTKIQIPFESNQVSLLKTSLLLTPIKDRKIVNLTTCSSQISKSISINLSEDIKTIISNLSGSNEKLDLRFNKAIEAVRLLDYENYFDYIFSRKKKSPNKVIQFFNKLFKRK